MFLDLMQKRRSIRNFKNMAVEDEKQGHKKGSLQFEKVHRNLFVKK